LIQPRSALLALALIVTLVDCETAPVTGRRQLILVNQEQEIQLGAQAFVQAKAQSRISDDPAANAAVSRVGQRIASATGLKLPWEFVVFESNQVNAFALPGGKVAVYTGILPITQDDAGLAAVLGHEIGHVLAHHGAERVSRSELAQLGTGLAAALLGGGDPGSQQLMGALLGAGVTYGIEMPFSREQEYEADRVGLSLMAQAGYDPRAALGFWQRMMARQHGTGGPEFLSDHPSDQNRLAELQRLLPEALVKYHPR
jgi:predicted Zn-dependent protease